MVRRAAPLFATTLVAMAAFGGACASSTTEDASTADHDASPAEDGDAATGHEEAVPPGAASDGGGSDADATRANCVGVLLDTDPKNCGVCGHDCRGAACVRYTCRSFSIGTFPGTTGTRAVARGVVSGKLVWVVGDGPALKIVSVDPGAPGTSVQVVASGIAPLVPGASDDRLAAITDDAVFVVHQVLRSTDPSSCDVVHKATDKMCVHVQRVDLATGAVDTWTSFTWNDRWFAAGAAALGDRLLVNDGSLVLEVTKTAGYTGRYVWPVRPSRGLAMDAQSAWVAAGKIVRIDLATFKTTDVLASNGFGTILGMVGSTLYATLTDTIDVRLVSLDTANAAATPVELARRPYQGQFAAGAVSVKHVLFSADWQVPGSGLLHDVALELATGRVTPQGTFDTETAIPHDGWSYGFIGGTLLRVAP